MDIFALRKKDKPMEQSHKSILFIVNPISGGIKKDRIIKAIEKEMASTSCKWEILKTEYAGHATEIARRSEADIVVAVGGDGTVSEVAHGLTGTDKALGIVPCGSGDGLALHLGLSRTPIKALRQILGGELSEIDYGDVNGHPFFCTTGVGFDAEVSLAFAKAKKRGLKTYITESWNIWKHYKALDYEITVDGKSRTVPAMFITVGNANQWGNRARITPDASIRDGRLDITAVKPFRFFQFPALGIRLFTGTANKSRKVLHLRGEAITIRRPVEGAVHFDGDPSEMGKNLEIRIHKAALKVIVPKRRVNKI